MRAASHEGKTAVEWERAETDGIFGREDAEYDSAAAAAVIVRVGIVADDLAGNGRNGDYEVASPATAVAASSGCDTSNGIYLVDARRRRRCGADDRDERQMSGIVILIPGIVNVMYHASSIIIIMDHGHNNMLLCHF